MQSTWSLLSLAAAFAVAAWGWKEALRLRDIANQAATEACERLGLQLLDGTSAFGAWRWRRTAWRLTLRRVYVFDYAAGSIDRRQGFVVLAGQQVESVGFAGRDEPPAASPVAPARGVLQRIERPTQGQDERVVASRSPPVADNVLNLSDWRRTRRHDEPLH